VSFPDRVAELEQALEQIRKLAVGTLGEDASGVQTDAITASRAVFEIHEVVVEALSLDAGSRDIPREIDSTADRSSSVAGT
jgi:hypothetical protein